MDEKILKEKNDDLAKNASMAGASMYGETYPGTACLEFENSVFIPCSRYEELLKAETKLNIIIDNVKANSESYKYDHVIKAVLNEDVKENAE